jgi:uncharacterized iron-regulated membrane protein
MSSRASLLVGFALAIGALAGCKGILKKRTDVTPSATVAAAASSAPNVTAPSAVAAAAETAPPPAALDENAVPTPEDFEEEAAEKVTAKNFKTELAQLKKDIGN